MTPPTPAPQRDLAKVIDELLHVLHEERTALRALNSSRVEQATTRKLDLAGRMIELAAAGPLDQDDTDRILRVQQELRVNHLLLAHARSCLRDVIRAATGAPSEPYGNPGSSVTSAGVQGVRIDVRG